LSESLGEFAGGSRFLRCAYMLSDGIGRPTRSTEMHRHQPGLVLPRFGANQNLGNREVSSRTLCEQLTLVGRIAEEGVPKPETVATDSSTNKHSRITQANQRVFQPFRLDVRVAGGFEPAVHLDQGLRVEVAADGCRDLRNEECIAERVELHLEQVTQ
jgi:hypothetical protein